MCAVLLYDLKNSGLSIVRIPVGRKNSFENFKSVINKKIFLRGLKVLFELRDSTVIPMKIMIIMSRLIL